MKKIIIFIALASLFACTKDADEVNNDNLAQDNAKEWFNTTFKSSSEWQQNAESPNKFPDWNKGTYLKKDSLEVFEFPLKEDFAEITVPKNESLTSKEINKILDATLLRLVIIKTDTNKMTVRKLYYVPEYKYLQSKGNDISNVMLGSDNDDFTGLLITKNWNDEVLSYLTVQEGKIKGMLVKKDSNNNTTAKVINELDEVVVMNNYQQRSYFITPPPPVFYSYAPVVPINPYGTSGGGTMTNPVTATAAIAQSIVNKIDPTKLDPCLQGIYSQLKNASNSSIKQILEKLGAKNVYTVNMVMGNVLKAEDYAQTQKIAANNYLITVDPNKYNGGTKLYKAQAMLHEITHAFFRSLVDDANNFPIGGEPFVGFPILYQRYCEASYPKTLDADHDQIANKYVDAIAQALQEYDANKAVPYQVYTDLVWGGLRDTPDYNKKTTVEKQRIEARFLAEQNGVYSKGQYAVGKKCN